MQGFPAGVCAPQMRRSSPASRCSTKAIQSSSHARAQGVPWGVRRGGGGSGFSVGGWAFSWANISVMSWSVYCICVGLGFGNKQPLYICHFLLQSDWGIGRGGGGDRGLGWFGLGCVVGLHGPSAHAARAGSPRHLELSVSTPIFA